MRIAAYVIRPWRSRSRMMLFLISFSFPVIVNTNWGISYICHAVAWNWSEYTPGPRYHSDEASHWAESKLDPSLSHRNPQCWLRFPWWRTSKVRRSCRPTIDDRRYSDKSVVRLGTAEAVSDILWNSRDVLTTRLHRLALSVARASSTNPWIQNDFSPDPLLSIVVYTSLHILWVQQTLLPHLLGQLVFRKKSKCAICTFRILAIFDVHLHTNLPDRGITYFSRGIDDSRIISNQNLDRIPLGRLNGAVMAKSTPISYEYEMTINEFNWPLTLK